MAYAAKLVCMCAYHTTGHAGGGQNCW